MNLYELKQNYNNLVEVLENVEADDNLRELIKNSLEEVNDSITGKVDNLVKLIKNLEADAEKIKEEEKRLAEKRKSLEKKAENLKKYLFDFTSTLEGKKVKADIFTVSIKKNPASVVIDDLDSIPEEYKRAKVTIEPIKTVLKQVLKEKTIEGCHLEQKESLNIK